MDDPWIAWCVDEAIFLFGNWVEGEISEATEKASNKRDARGRAERVLKACLGNSDSKQEWHTFADPQTTSRKKKGMVTL